MGLSLIIPFPIFFPLPCFLVCAARAKWMLLEPLKSR